MKIAAVKKKPKQANLPNSQEMLNEAELPIEEDVVDSIKELGWMLELRLTNGNTICQLYAN